MKGAVDPSYWTTRYSFGPAGGPLVHALTPEGTFVAYSVGAQVSTQHAKALHALTEDVLYATEERINGLVFLSPLLRVYPFQLFRDLAERGYVRVLWDEPLRMNTFGLTPEGVAAQERGYLEADSLLARVRLAHPLCKLKDPRAVCLCAEGQCARLAERLESPDGT